MSVMAQWKELSDPDLMKAFLTACARPEDIQTQVLLDILLRSRETEFGRQYQFETIRSVADFQRQVPVQDWDQFSPYSQRMQAGKPDILFPGIPRHFIETSGTTGKFKWIPESPAGMQAKAITSRLRMTALIRAMPSLVTGRFLPLSNSAVLGKTEAGIPFGTASGLTLTSTPEAIRQRMSFPLDVLRVANFRALDYLVMRFSVAHPNLRLVVGNKSGRMLELFRVASEKKDQIIDDIEQGAIQESLQIQPELRALLSDGLKPDPDRAQALRGFVAARGDLLPRDYWPELRMVACWLSGTIGRDVQKLESWLPETPLFMDCGYGASEGKLNIPLVPGQAEAPLAIGGYFFEFVPLAGGDPLLAHQVRDGESYVILITTYSGLYRYDLHDIVAVKGFTQGVPNISFVSKAGDVGNIAGEKISAVLLLDILRLVADARGVRFRQACVVPEVDNARYVFCLEPEPGSKLNRDFLCALEKALSEDTAFYSLLRMQKTLQAPRLVEMKPGWQERLHTDRMRPGVSTNQIKLPILWESIPHPEMAGESFDLCGPECGQSPP